MNNDRKPGMNKREKMLVMAAVALAIVVLGLQFVILPLNKEVGLRRDIYEGLSMEALEIEDNLIREEVIVQTHRKAQADVEEASLIYPKKLPNEEIDRVMTRLCMSSGLSPRSLQIGVPAAVKISDVTGGRREADAFCTVAISMGLSGDYYSLRSLIDEVNRTENLRITKFTFNMNANSSSAFSVTFEMTMLAQ